MEGRDTRDVESVEMLDIIYSNRVFDFGDTIFCSEIRDGKLRYMLVDKNYDLTSALREGTNELVIEVSNTLAGAIRDGFSGYLAIPASGLTGAPEWLK
jgi:hypothetical protein